MGAIDRRVRCVACQVPLISGHQNARRIVRSDFLAPVGAMFDDDRAARYAGQPPAMIPVVDEDPMAPSALPTPDSYQWFTETGADAGPLVAQRGDPAQRGDVLGVRARRLHRLDLAHAASSWWSRRRTT